MSTLISEPQSVNSLAQTEFLDSKRDGVVSKIGSWAGIIAAIGAGYSVLHPSQNGSDDAKLKTITEKLFKNGQAFKE